MTVLMLSSIANDTGSPRATKTLFIVMLCISAHEIPSLKDSSYKLFLSMKDLLSFRRSSMCLNCVS